MQAGVSPPLVDKERERALGVRRGGGAGEELDVAVDAADARGVGAVAVAKAAGCGVREAVAEDARVGEDGAARRDLAAVEDHARDDGRRRRDRARARTVAVERARERRVSGVVPRQGDEVPDLLGRRAAEVAHGQVADAVDARRGRERDLGERVTRRRFDSTWARLARAFQRKPCTFDIAPRDDRSLVERSAETSGHRPREARAG